MWTSELVIGGHRNDSCGRVLVVRKWGIPGDPCGRETEERGFVDRQSLLRLHCLLSVDDILAVWDLPALATHRLGDDVLLWIRRPPRSLPVCVRLHQRPAGRLWLRPVRSSRPAEPRDDGACVLDHFLHLHVRHLDFRLRSVSIRRSITQTMSLLFQSIAYAITVNLFI